MRKSSRRKKGAAAACCALLSFAGVAAKPLSDPIGNDSPDTTNNKFLARSAFRDELGGTCGTQNPDCRSRVKSKVAFYTRLASRCFARPRRGDDEPYIDEHVNQCPVDISLRWMTEVASSIYATPVIADLFSDGQKEVIVPTFVHYFEVLEVRLAETMQQLDSMFDAFPSLPV